jgi:hypothetical protein
MASFDENGKYIKTNWKAGDKITSTKLNKIEESIEAVNDNDISRHVEADTRLDALEAKDVAHDKELTNIKKTIADNKAAAELGDYEINSRMQLLEEELNEGIEEVHNVAETVDGKIAQAESDMAAQVNAAQANMTAQVKQGKADMEAMVAEVEADLEGLHDGIDIISNTVVSNLRNTEGFINEIFRVCQTYTDNFDLLVYGNRYTAWDSVVQTVNGKYELDCSSFINLLIHGVEFQKSRYAGNDDNTCNPLFFNSIDSYEFRLANQIAKYCVDNGYAFIPSSLEEIQAGDIVFYSWTGYDENPEEYTQAQIDFHNNAFMKIDHVAMYLARKNDTFHHTIQYEQYTPQFLYTVSEGYMEQAVLVARLPFASIQENDTADLIVNGNTKKTCVNTNVVGKYYLSKSLKKGKMYTMVIDGQIDTDECYFVIQDPQWNTLYSDNGVEHLFNGTRVIHFLYQGEGVNVINISLGAPSHVSTTRNGCVNWCSLYEGYKITIPDKQGSSSSHIRELQIRQNIKDVMLNDYAFTNSLIEYDSYYLVNLNLTVNTDYKSNPIIIGDIEKLSITQRIPCVLISHDNVVTGGAIQFNTTGEIMVVKYDSDATWRHAIASGIIVK